MDRIHRQEEHVPALTGGLVEVRDRQRDGADHHPADQRGPEGCRNDGSRHGVGGLHRLFRGMGRGVIAGDRVDRQQQAQQEQVAHVVRLREHAAAGVARVVVERPESAHIKVRGEVEAAQHQNGGRREDDVARNVGQEGRDLDAEVVEQRLHDRDDGHEGHDLQRGRAIETDHRPEGAGKVERRADVDGAQHGDQAEQVHPGGDPADEAVAEDRAPVVKPARRRKGRGDLRHRQREHARHNAAGDPADAKSGAADRRDALRERVDAARQDADDREGDREVRELAHAARKFLGIAHAVEDLEVLLAVMFRVVVRHVGFSEPLGVPVPCCKGGAPHCADLGTIFSVWQAL